MADYPLLVFAVSFLALMLSVRTGAKLFRRLWPPDESTREDSGAVLAGALTLLGLIVGFSFSMAVTRYDQRKNLEEAEANAIGTEYIRADLLPAADAVKVRTLLRAYFDQRVLWYTTRNEQEIQKINTRTAQLQAGLWAAVVAPAMATPTPVASLAVAGMNDVLNSQGYTQAAWWNRIPGAAWCLMAAIAICCHLLVGYCARKARSERAVLLVLPVVTSISLFLIADIDSPRNGVIRVQPDNLMSIAESLRVL